MSKGSWEGYPTYFIPIHTLAVNTCLNPRDFWWSDLLHLPACAFTCQIKMASGFGIALPAIHKVIFGFIGSQTPSCWSYQIQSAGACFKASWNPSIIVYFLGTFLCTKERRGIETLEDQSPANVYMLGLDCFLNRNTWCKTKGDIQHLMASSQKMEILSKLTCTATVPGIK